MICEYFLPFCGLPFPNAYYMNTSLNCGVKDTFNVPQHSFLSLSSLNHNNHPLRWFLTSQLWSLNGSRTLVREVTAAHRVQVTPESSPRHVHRISCQVSDTVTFWGHFSSCCWNQTLWTSGTLPQSCLEWDRGLVAPGLHPVAIMVVPFSVRCSSSPPSNS